MMFGGDHLLANISSNALVDTLRPESIDHPGSGSLLAYIDSLRATRALELTAVLAGHGPLVEDHVSLIDQRLAQHEHRASCILKLVRERACSAQDIARSIGGDVDITQVYLTISEVLGHIDLLLERGLVVLEGGGEVTVFAAED